MLRVAVLSGGDSAEREVSLASGQQVQHALARAGYETALLDPAEQRLGEFDWSRFDVAFVALHGGAGEDGRVQAELERLGVPYTGSGPAASRLAMSKSATKARLRAAGVDALPGRVVLTHEHRSLWLRQAARLARPWAVKPDAQGSSLGVGRARTADELLGCIAEAGRYGERVLLEPWLVGRELTVTVLDRRSLPVIEIIPPGEFFDYRAKYVSTETRLGTAHDLGQNTLRAIRRMAIRAARVLGCRGLVRVDLIYPPSGDPVVLEVNTVPGLTAHSLAPLAASRAGLSLTQLCAWMVDDALAGRRRRTLAAAA